MTDLERFFRQLVANLAASDPSRLHHPLPLEEILGSIVPYRSNRRALHLESSEDYELVLLRLAAGEGGFVRTEPEEARKKLAAAYTRVGDIGDAFKEYARAADLLPNDIPTQLAVTRLLLAGGAFGKAMQCGIVLCPAGPSEFHLLRAAMAELVAKSG